MNQADQQAKESKRKMKSTAGKIHRLFLGKILLIFLFFDIALGGLFVTGLVYTQETELLGEFSPKTMVDLRHNDEEQLRVIFDNGTDRVTWIPSEEFLSCVRWGSMGILGIEGFLFLWAFLFYRFPIRRRLRPLREMAESAQRLSTFNWEQEKMANLTYAISHLDAESGTPRLETHDSELAGIENAMNDLLDRMRESYREQTRFVSDASHELRTPIAVIKGYADMLDRWGKEDQQVLEEGIAAIRSESDRMNTLVEQLLFLARGDAGRQHLTMENINLTALMQEVYDESVMIDQKHSYELQKEPGDIVCYGDYGMLKQAVRIFVDNAAKYTTEGDTISLRVGINRARLCPYVSVQDNGIGMSREDVQHIFERFYRSDVARNSKTGGTGLGLSIAKWIVDRHRGTIEVVSRQEIGTRFTVFLQPGTAVQGEETV